MISNVTKYRILLKKKTKQFVNTKEVIRERQIIQWPAEKKANK